MRQHAHRRLIPLKFDDWDFFDRDYFEWYICKHMHVLYKERQVMAPIGYSPWDEDKILNFNC